MKTTVEWLEEMFNNSEIPNSSMLFKQAKEMEKQEKKSNWIGGYLTCAMKDHNLPYGKKYLNFLADKELEAEQYYNETFKSE
jgi:hypothetical protein